MRPLAIAAVAALIAGPNTFAQEPVGCDKFKWPVDRETAALRALDLKAIASGTEIAALPFAATISLKAPKDAGLPAPPERAPKDGTFAGFASSKGVTPGIYSVALSAPAWLDLVQGGQFLKAKSFSGVQGCDGIRKVVKFELTGQPFTLQISGVATDRIAVTLMPAAD
jgi:hypothetical protein